MRDSDSLKLRYQCHGTKCGNTWITYAKRREGSQMCEVCFQVTNDSEIIGLYEPKPQGLRDKGSNGGLVVDDDETEYYSVGV